MPPSVVVILIRLHGRIIGCSSKPVPLFVNVCVNLFVISAVEMFRVQRDVISVTARPFVCVHCSSVVSMT